jgi:hypothetical protein
MDESDLATLASFNRRMEPTPFRLTRHAKGYVLTDEGHECFRVPASTPERYALAMAASFVAGVIHIRQQVITAMAQGDSAGNA